MISRGANRVTIRRQTRSRLAFGAVGLVLGGAGCGETPRDYSASGSVDAAFDASLVLDAEADAGSVSDTESGEETDVATITVDITKGDVSSSDAGSLPSDGGATQSSTASASEPLGNDASSSGVHTDSSATSKGAIETAELDSGVGSGETEESSVPEAGAFTSDVVSSEASDASATGDVVDGGDAADGGSSETAVTSSGATDTIVVSSNPSDAGTDAGSPDSGATDDSSGETSSGVVEPVEITLDASGTGNLVGYPIVVTAVGEASDDSEVTYAWEFESVPDGSEIDGESIQGDGSEVRFLPDRAGEYVVTVTASAGGVEATIDVTVQATAYDIGYLNVAGDLDSWTRAGFMIRSDGTNNRQVGCYFPSTATSEEAWLKEFVSTNQFGFQAYLPSDEDSVARFAYNYEGLRTGPLMYIAGEDSNCDTNPPVEVAGGILPVFSPSGQRVSVVTETAVAGASSTHNLITYDVTGTDARTLRTGAGTLVGVSWPDDDTVLWTELDSNSRVYKAPDVDGVFDNDLLTQVVLDCDVVENPLVVWGRAVERDGQLFVWVIGDPLSIWRLEEVAGGAYDCSADALTNHQIVADNVIDFDVSPDGRSLLYYVRYTGAEGEPSYSTLFLRDLDADEPIVLSSEANTIASGAHFAMGGRQVVWTETRQTVVTVSDETSTSSYERPAESRLMIANIDGQNTRVLTTVSSSSSQVRAMHTGANTFLPTFECSVGRPLGVMRGGVMRASH